ncbi:MAG: chemotaxis response regulator protein-glutamate methylesterase [Pseudomonadales bacterium]|nr:chemotaxis response regulator protein-glutamate methylesterase [Pseudomonadales bacterium]
MTKKKVLIVDDSQLIRSILTEIINSAGDLQVVGTAIDPYDAREKIKSLLPDVITLDIEMPKMDGISFLKNLMRLRPMPVVMISTLTEKGAPATLEALALGAVDYIAKPKANEANALNAYANDIIEKVRVAANANVQAPTRNTDPGKQPRSGAQMEFRNDACIAIGASTGGTEAIKEVLMSMPLNCPPIVIAQHIPPVFSTTYAERMNRTCGITVKEAQSGDILAPGAAYLAPGDDHLLLKRKGAQYVCELSKADPVNRHRPSVEVLFDSVASVVGEKSVAALLTGMGADGAAALLRLKQAGAFTIAQDEQTSVVWGMPGVAVKLGAAEKVLPLKQVGRALLGQCLQKK